MKIVIRISLIASSLIVAASGLFAEGIYFDPSASSSSSWTTGAHWSLSDSGPYDQLWADLVTGNDTAYFSTSAAAYSVTLSGETVNLGSGGIYRESTGANDVMRIIGESGSKLVFDGGTIYAGSLASKVLTINQGSSAVKVEGTFTVTGGQVIISGSSLAFTGTATVSGEANDSARFAIDRPTAVSSESNIVLTKGMVNIGWTDGAGTDFNLGAVTFAAVSSSSAATFQIGAISGTEGLNVTVTSLSGNQGSINLRNAAAGGTKFSTLIVDQDTNTTYSGVISGNGTNHQLGLVKTGSGQLRLHNNVTIRAGIVVEEGTLLINTGGSTRNISNENDDIVAIKVMNGGTFGGDSELAIQNNDHVVVENGGALSPGNNPGAVGRTTFTFSGSGEVPGSLDLSGVTTATGWLKFDLGADTTPATTYDQITVKDGVLDIGIGLLEFNDFDFNPLDGFGDGVYTLLSLTGTGALEGTLGSSLSGYIAGQHYGTLYLDGDTGNLMLHVATAIPEPSAGLLLGCAGLLFLLIRKRRKATPRL